MIADFIYVNNKKFRIRKTGKTPHLRSQKPYECMRKFMY